MEDTRKSILLPFDVWQHTSAYLPVKDLLCLSLVSKSLYNMMIERSIWHDALQDILRIIPVPRIQRSLLTMTAAECKYEAVRLVRKDATWRRGDVDPTDMRRFNYISIDVRRVLFVPGGDWVVTLLSDGTLRLHRWPDLGGPAVCSTERSDADKPHFDYQVDVELSVSALNSIRALVWEYYFDSGVEHCRARLYDIDTTHPELRFIKSVTFHDAYYMRISCYDTRYAFFRVGAVHEPQACLVDVRTIGLTPEMNVSMRIDDEDGPFMPGVLPSTQLISQDVYLIASQRGLYLFAVPPLIPETDPSSASAVPTPPFWVHSFSKAYNLAPRSGPLFSKENGVGSQCFLYLLTEIQSYIVSLSFPNERPSISILPHVGISKKALKPLKTPHRYVIGARRVVLASVERQHPQQPVVVLKSWDHAAWPDGIADMGMMRFGNPAQQSNLPVGLRIPFEDPEEDLGDFAWDEETRRVCLLLTRQGRRQTIRGDEMVTREGTFGLALVATNA